MINIKRVFTLVLIRKVHDEDFNNIMAHYIHRYISDPEIIAIFFFTTVTMSDTFRPLLCHKTSL